jgi:Trk K+ transport system NAD-binding subunit
MKAVVMGAGDVGRTLAGSLASAGREVAVGARDPRRAGDEHPDVGVPTATIEALRQGLGRRRFLKVVTPRDWTPGEADES